MKSTIQILMNSHQSVSELHSPWPNSKFFNLGLDILLSKTITYAIEMDETKVASRNISLYDMDEGEEPLAPLIGSWFVCIYIASSPKDSWSISISFTQIATAEEVVAWWGASTTATTMKREEYTHQSLANYNFELLRLPDSSEQFVIAFSESESQVLYE